MHGIDGEEMWHADYNQKRGVVTLPDFGNPIVFPGYYETSLIEMKGCKSDVATLTNIFKSPPPEMGKAWKHAFKFDFLNQHQLCIYTYKDMVTIYKKDH